MFERGEFATISIGDISKGYDARQGDGAESFFGGHADKSRVRLPLDGESAYAFDSMIGTSLDHYQVLEKIGAGGMGEVYRARDGKLGRDVAIKVLPEVFAQSLFPSISKACRLARKDRLLSLTVCCVIGTVYNAWRPSKLEDRAIEAMVREE